MTWNGEWGKFLENRWWSEIENRTRGNLGMPAGLIVPGDSHPGGAVSGVATQSKHGEQDLKVVPTPKARPGFEIDTSNRNMSLRYFLHLWLSHLQLEFSKIQKS